MVGLIGHIVDNSEKYPGKLGKILMRPKKKVFSEDSSLQFGLRIRKNTPHKFRKKLGKILQKTLTTCLLSTSEPSYGKYSTTTKNWAKRSA